MSGRNIPVADAIFDDAELDAVTDAVKERAVSGLFGTYIEQFESEFAQFVGCRFGVAVSNGTTAIHLALATLGIGAGDEVLVSSYTNMATFFPVLYCGAVPVAIDVERDTWNIDNRLIEERITPRTRAIIVVHIFGHPVDMDPIMEIARRHDLYVIEDCAQAHGALYKGREVGSIGAMSCFSFYANKIITTGEGGMVTTNDPALAEKARSLKSLAYGTTDRFMHEAVGYNYRMTNVQAAIGCAQMRKIEELIAGKRRLASEYRQRLSESRCLRLPVERDYAKNVYWMYHVVLEPEAPKARAQVMTELRARGIESRPGFVPYNMQKIFVEKGIVEPESCPTANDLARNAFYIPSSSNISKSDIEYVADSLLAILKV